MTSPYAELRARLAPLAAAQTLSILTTPDTESAVTVRLHIGADVTVLGPLENGEGG